MINSTRFYDSELTFHIKNLLKYQFVNRSHCPNLCNMKQALFPAVLLMSVMIISCNDDSSGRTRARQELAIPRDSRPYDSSILSPVSNKNTSAIIQAQPIEAKAISPTSQTPAPPMDSAAIMLANGLNPPHGSFGHRCELKVGDPLGSKPASPLPANSVQPNTATPAPPATQSGLNPAHGRPGHRCDIAVGAPLNSKPTNPLPANSVQPNTAKPVPPATQSGLNPAHGQPGHRCDIAVGAPLNSKPNNTVAPANIDTTKKAAIAKPDSVKN